MDELVAAIVTGVTALLSVLFLLVRVWCYVANKLASLSAIAHTLTNRAA